ncbi:MAG: TIGR02587 family membrane protein [Halomonas sp.]|nr:TIGR02587 family membrane protein [Halomonas sp.]
MYMQGGLGAMQQKTTTFLTSLARAFGGAILFAFPIMMTMETWWLGAYLSGEKIGLFMLVALPILFGVSRASGFRPTLNWFEDAVDTFVAYAVGLVTVAVFLWLFGVFDLDEPLAQAAGQIGLLSVPCAFGAILASKQLGNQRNSNEQRQSPDSTSYYNELGIMVAGALYGAFTVSPTQEMYLIAYKASPWQLLGLIGISLLCMHGFVYSMSFRGEEYVERKLPFISYTVVGYAISLGMSAYMLWTFDRLDGLSLAAAAMVVIVLSFPASIGAAASRLII